VTGAVPAEPAGAAAGSAGGASAGSAGGAAAGSIYDLGYQRYEGPRLGRRHAIRALFVHSLRSSYGIGRGGRAKMAPIILGFLAIVPALAGIALIALARQMAAGGDLIEENSPIRHDTYFGVITALVGLFCAIQAPELVGRDLRHRLPSLYFSRALQRTDYGLARLAGLAVAIFLFVMLPQTIIFAGLVLSADDVGVALGRELGQVPPTVLQAAILSVVLGAISTVVSSLTSRRAYAATTIIAILVITPALADQLIQRGSEALGFLVLLSPGDVLAATNGYLFGVQAESDAVIRADLPGELYLVAAAVMVLAAAGLLLRRLMRLEA
jgi:ABC-2 type transport system permease protein